TPPRHHGCVRWKRRHAHAASSFRSIRSRGARKSRAPSMGQRPRMPERSTCWHHSLLFNSRAFIFDRVATQRLPAVYQWPEMAGEGALIGYGPLTVQLYRHIRSRQRAKLLRGVKPADLPVEQPTRFELVINLQTARAIGHEVPAGLVLRADKVIE